MYVAFYIILCHPLNQHISTAHQQQHQATNKIFDSLNQLDIQRKARKRSYLLCSVCAFVVVVSQTCVGRYHFVWGSCMQNAKRKKTQTNTTEQAKEIPRSESKGKHTQPSRNENIYTM